MTIRDLAQALYDIKQLLVDRLGGDRSDPVVQASHKAYDLHNEALAILEGPVKVERRHRQAALHILERGWGHSTAIVRKWVETGDAQGQDVYDGLLRLHVRIAQALAWNEAGRDPRSAIADLRDKWAVDVLDVWALVTRRAPFRTWPPKTGDSTKNWECSSSDETVRVFGFGKTPEEARMEAAEAVLDELPEAERLMMGPRP